MDEYRIQYIPNVFKEERPARPVQGERFAIASDVVTCAGYGRDKEHRAEQSEHNHRRSYVRPIPFHASLQDVEDDANQRAHHNHRVQANQTTLKEVTERHRLAQSVVVRISDYET